MIFTVVDYLIFECASGEVMGEVCVGKWVSFKGQCMCFISESFQLLSLFT